MTLKQEHRKLDFEEINFVNICSFYEEELRGFLGGKKISDVLDKKEITRLKKRGVLNLKFNNFAKRRLLVYSLTSRADMILNELPWSNLLFGGDNV